jgi:D-alanine-D-alanine ligase
MGKLNVAVVMGGFSSEKDISIKSGNIVAQFLDKEKFNVYNAHILINKWVVLINNQEFVIDKNDFSVIINNEKITFDIVFNAIHGNPGENGKLIAYFDLIGQKHTSAPFYQMALTFNKRDCLSILNKYKIPMAQSVYLNKGDVINEDEIINKVGLPCFVKPNNAGSSYGISKVHTAAKLQDALDYAFAEDTEVLIESFLDGTEVSVGVIKLKDGVKVLGITEIVSEYDFFDYEAK